MSIVALITDFGQRDGYVGVMIGVIWSIAPGTAIADITHEVEPQNVAEAALLLSRTAPFFPQGAIMVAVVDPGVGTSRRPLLAQIGERYFIGPDNGLVGIWLEQAEARRERTRFIHLNRPEYWLDQVSSVFHGRDIFAPTAAHLASGVPIEAFGTEIADPVRFALPQPERTPFGWRGEIIHVDHFGNLETNLSAGHLSGKQVTAVKLHSAYIEGLASTFGDRPADEPTTIINSSGNLEIALVNGNAARRLNAAIGDPVEIYTT